VLAFSEAGTVAVELEAGTTMFRGSFDPIIRTRCVIISTTSTAQHIGFLNVR